MWMELLLSYLLNDLGAFLVKRCIGMPIGKSALLYLSASKANILDDTGNMEY